MIKRLLLVAALCLMSGAAFAQCVPLPYTLTNGTIADANQVMANFNAVNTCAQSGTPMAPSNAAMAALTTATVPNGGIIRLGFATKGDAPPMLYVPENGTCAANARISDGGSCVNTTSGDGNSFYTVFPASGADVREFGAVGNGSTDNSAAVSAVVAYWCAASPPGGIVRFPPGNFKLHDVTANCAGMHFIGAGQGGVLSGTGDATWSSPTTTVLDCSAMTDHCLQLGPNSGSPANNRVVGGSIEKLTTLNTAGTGVVFRVHQQFGPILRDLWMQNPPHPMEFFGNQNAVTSMVNIRGPTADPQIEVWGNLTAPAACTLATCATRQDLTTFEHVNSFSGNSVGFIYVHDQTFGTNGSFVTNEGGAYGIKVRCAAGQPNAGSCPQQLRWFDFEDEGATLPLDLQDFTAFECTNCFLSGIGGGGSAHVISASMVNYPTSAVGGGLVTISNSTIFGANGSCALFAVPDVFMSGNEVYGCNLSNNAIGTNDAAIELGASNTNSTFIGNSLCDSLSGGGFPNEIGFLFGSGSTRASLSSNNYFGCAQNQVNNSASPATMIENGPNPPPPAGAVSAITGCGTGCTVVFSSGNEFGGSLLMTSGTSPAATGNFAISFPQPLYPSPICSFLPRQGGSGSLPSGSVLYLPSSTTSMTVSWTNGGVALAPSTGFFIDYKCSGF